MTNRNVFLGFGVFFLLSFCFMMFVMVMAGSTSFNYNSLIVFALTALSFSQYMAFPHIATNDERAKEIRSKALSYSSIVVLLTLGALNLFLFMKPALFTASELIQIIITFMIVTQSSLLVVMTKRI